jgi:hypothetical protein
VIAWGIPILVLVDLAWMNGGYLRGLTRGQVDGALPRDPLIEQFRSSLPPGRLLVLAPTLDYRRRPIHPWFFPGRLFHYGVESTGGYGPFLLKDYVETFQRMDPNQPVYNGGLLLYLFDLEGVNSEVFSLFQVSGVISPGRPIRGYPVEASHTYLGAGGEMSELFLCRNPHSYPRAFLYRDSPDYPRPDPVLGNVEVLEASSTCVRLVVDAREDCRLALLETWYPGWKCTTHGLEKDIAKTAGTFRSVEIQQGHSEVVFTYEPTSWRRGLTLSAVGILATALLLLL